jgi:uncharacterized small protein (DUF1192 family)
MFDEDLEKKPQPMGPKNLETMSVDELRAYIEDLKEEIDRVQQDIEKKLASHEAASSVFKS